MRDAFALLASTSREGVTDATAGQVLRGELVKVARELDMEYFKAKNFHTNAPPQAAYRRAGKAPMTV